MAAGRIDMMRSALRDRAIGIDKVARRGTRHMAAIGGDSIPTRGDADDFAGCGLVQFGHAIPANTALTAGTRPSATSDETGREPCRERVCTYVYVSVVAVYIQKKKINNE